MAEIKIKEKSPIWPWILLVLAILVVLYLLFFTGDDDDVDDMNADDVEMIDDGAQIESDYDDNTASYEDSKMASDNATSKVMAYNDYMQNHGEMTIDHDYSNTALEHLIEATVAMANQWNVDITADMSSARTQVASITKDPYEVDHANKIKNAGQTIVNAIKTIQNQKFPDVGTADLESSLAAIKTDVQTLEQKTAVKNFFDEAGELLTNMKNK